jgi:YgiT-type zinc finger domain-containing protein
MKCVVCQHGETTGGTATVTLTRDATTLVIKKAPVQICRNCGEEYVDDLTTAGLLRTTEEAEGAGVRFGVREYIAFEI